MMRGVRNPGPLVAICLGISVTVLAQGADKDADKAARRAEVLRAYDANGDGRLDETERAAAQAERDLERGKRAFQSTTGGRTPDPDRARAKQERLKLYDKNGDGQLDAAERELAKADRNARRAKGGEKKPH